MTWLLAAWAALKKVPSWLYAAAGVLLAIALAYLKGKSAGRAQAQAQADRKAVETVNDMGEVAREVGRLTDDQRRQELERWER